MPDGPSNGENTKYRLGFPWISKRIYLRHSLDFQHLILDHSGLCLYVYDISHLPSDQCMTYRGFVGNFVLKAVCLRGTDDFEFHLFVLINIVDLYLAANVYLI